MRTKLTAAQELRMERKRLREECQIHKDRITNTTAYMKDHIGSILLNQVIGSSKIGLSTLFGSKEKTKSITNSPAFAAVPVVWNIAQPFLIGWATKKLTSKLFGKKRR